MSEAVSGLRRAILGVGLLALAGCGSTFSTKYDPVPSGITQNWRVTDVRVNVPDALKVSEEKSWLPKADIVWREDPEGDRKAQVAKIIRDAAMSAAAPLRGRQAVVLDITLKRFHALTFEAETQLSDMGVHDIEFTLTARDAKTGQVLAGPDAVDASLKAYSGTTMARMRREGQTQKGQITAHLKATFAGWLGIGPDNRGTFTRVGG